MMLFQDANLLIVVGQSDAGGEAGHPSADNDNVVIHSKALYNDFSPTWQGEEAM
jgi:hypothetical protein